MPSKDIVDNAREVIQKQQAQLDELKNPSSSILGVVRAVYFDSLVIEAGNNIYQIMSKETKQYKPGDTVALHPATMNVLGTSKYRRVGKSGSVLSVSKEFIEVSIEGNSHFIEETKVHSLKKGDRVLLDVTNTVIVAQLESEAERFLFSEKVNIGWDDIGGLEDAKKELQAAIEKPMQYPSIFKAFKKKTPKGHLLHGRPGNGKTLLAKAVATAVARIHGKETSDTGFIYIKGPEILNKYVGDTEGMIRSLFEMGRAHKKRHGYEAVMFFDEAEALFGLRTSHATTGIGHTVVPQFLSEMDGLEDSGVILLLATNRADTLDPAVVRPGRIDRKIYIAPPGREDAVKVVNVHMRGVPSKVSTEDVVDELYTEKYPLYKLFKNNGEEVLFGLKDLISGAMLASIVEYATSSAVDRHIDNKIDPIEGVHFGDFRSALCSIQRSQYGLNHELEVQEFAEAHNFKPTHIKSVIQPGA